MTLSRQYFLLVQFSSTITHVGDEGRFRSKKNEKKERGEKGHKRGDGAKRVEQWKFPMLIPPVESMEIACNAKGFI